MTTVADERILGAGGLVVKTEPGPADDVGGQPRFVLVHRKRYGDWSLPKGKSNANETLEQTALREVKEETGLGCRILRPLSEVHYRYTGGKGNAKVKSVLYFLMEVVDGAMLADGEEVDRVEWMDSRQAIETLSYEADKNIVGSFLGESSER